MTVDVARQQRNIQHGGVGAYVETRRGASARPAAARIAKRVLWGSTKRAKGATS